MSIEFCTVILLILYGSFFCVILFHGIDRKFLIRHYGRTKIQARLAEINNPIIRLIMRLPVQMRVLQELVSNPPVEIRKRTQRFKLLQLTALILFAALITFSITAYRFCQ